MSWHWFHTLGSKMPSSLGWNPSHTPQFKALYHRTTWAEAYYNRMFTHITGKYFFIISEHQNWFGMDENLGPVAVSIRREKVERQNDNSSASSCAAPPLQTFQYRLLIRTSEVCIVCQKLTYLFLCLLSFRHLVINLLCATNWIHFIYLIHISLRYNHPSSIHITNHVQP